MIAYYRPLLYASIWQLVSWLTALACAVRWQPQYATGILWGGLLMAINFSLLRFVAHLWHKDRGLSRRVALLVASKWLLLLTLCAAILHFIRPDGAGMALGMSTLFVGLLGATLHHRTVAPSPRPPLA